MGRYRVKIYDDGDKYKYTDGELHMEGAPAAEWFDGNKYWYINNELHREDGPAIERHDGSKEWYLEGEELTEKQYMKMKANEQI